MPPRICACRWAAASSAWPPAAARSRRSRRSTPARCRRPTPTWMPITTATGRCNGGARTTPVPCAPGPGAIATTPASTIRSIPVRASRAARRPRWSTGRTTVTVLPGNACWAATGWVQVPRSPAMTRPMCPTCRFPTTTTSSAAATGSLHCRTAARSRPAWTSPPASNGWTSTAPRRPTTRPSPMRSRRSRGASIPPGPRRQGTAAASSGS